MCFSSFNSLYLVQVYDSARLQISSIIQPGYLLQVLLEPSDSLREGLLTRKLLGLLAEIGAHSEAVNDLGVQVDLVRKTLLLEDLLGLVALLGGEDGIGLGGGNGERAVDAGDLLLVDERRVGDEADVDAGEGGGGGHVAD